MVLLPTFPLTSDGLPRLSKRAAEETARKRCQEGGRPPLTPPDTVPRPRGRYRIMVVRVPTTTLL